MIDPRKHTLTSDEFEYLEEPGTRGLAHNRHSRRMNQRTRLDGTLIGQTTKRGLEYCRLEGRDRLEPRPPRRQVSRDLRRTKMPRGRVGLDGHLIHDERLQL